MLTIPVTSALPHYSMDVALEGTAYVFTLRWNTRGEFWVLDIATESEAPVLSGAKLVFGAELIRDYADPRLPPGALVVVRSRGQIERIGREDLGTNAELVYLTAEEADALR